MLYYSLDDDLLFGASTCFPGLREGEMVSPVVICLFHYLRICEPARDIGPCTSFSFLSVGGALDLEDMKDGLEEAKRKTGGEYMEACKTHDGIVESAAMGSWKRWMGLANANPLAMREGIPSGCFCLYFILLCLVHYL